MALNKAMIMGRLVADPEVRTIGDDVHVTTVRIAVDRDRTNKETGEREADFLDVVAWRGTCDFLAKFFAKGDQVVVDGRLRGAVIVRDHMLHGEVHDKIHRQVKPPPHMPVRFDELRDFLHENPP